MAIHESWKYPLPPTAQGSTFHHYRTWYLSKIKGFSFLFPRHSICWKLNLRIITLSALIWSPLKSNKGHGGTLVIVCCSSSPVFTETLHPSRVDEIWVLVPELSKKPDKIVDSNMQWVTTSFHRHPHQRIFKFVSVRGQILFGVLLLAKSRFLFS